MSACLHRLDHLLWGPGTLALLLGTGVFLTVRTRLLPWRNLGWAIRAALGRDARSKREARCQRDARAKRETRSRQDGVSPFASLMTALAATVGTGNIVGVAAALTAGGPGALVWMEVAALFGLSTKFAECLLAVKFRRRGRDGLPYGGPMVVLRDGLGGRLGAFLGAAFALAAVGASLTMGCMAQANAITAALESAFPARSVGAVTALLALAVLLGGVRRVAGVSAVLVPAMALLYTGAGLLVILGNLDALPAAVASMLRCALSPEAAAGGTLGTALRWGVARGVFSNEAGLGTSAIAAASAETDSPVRQGYLSMTGVFFDTTVLCTVTGLAICVSGVLGAVDSSGVPLDGAALTILAFRTVLGPAGGALVRVSLVLFAFTTILGCAYQGETAWAFLGGAPALYRAAIPLAVLLGVHLSPAAVFHAADICNALLCLPNLIGLLALSGTVRRDALAFQPEIRRKHYKKR